MKAIRVREFGAPEVMKLEEVPDPVPGSGQVLVKVHAAGVNPVDTYIRSGNYANKPPLPYTPGTDAAGVVEAVGDEVTRFRAGDRVYVGGSVSGVYAEKVLCRVDHVHPLPAHATFQQGAAIHVPYTTAYRALYDRAKVKAGQTLLIHGATGGVGLAATQLAVAAGLTVIGTGGTDEGRKLVSDQGATHVLDHKSQGYLDQLMKITGGRGVDVILEMLANVNLAKDMTVLGKHGTIVVIGSRGTIEINPRELMRTEGAILGLLGAKPEELSCAHAALGAALRLGTIKPVAGTELPLADAAKAHHEVMERSAFGKIVLIP
jgi:NADPH2:quinone reductase